MKANRLTILPKIAVIGVFATLVVVGVLALLFTHPSDAFSLDEQPSSVEIGVVEFSPRGAAGGQAVPASGGSDPVCIVWLEDYVILPGESTTLRFTTSGVGGYPYTDIYEIGQNNVHIHRRSGKVTNTGLTVPNSEGGWGGLIPGKPPSANSPDNNNQYHYEMRTENTLGHHTKTETCAPPKPLTILVDSPPDVDLKIEGSDNTSITFGDDAEISWEALGYPHPDCTATTVAPDNTANWTGSKAWDGGPETVSPNPTLSPTTPSATYQYTLECTNGNGTDTDTGTLTVKSRPDLRVTTPSPSGHTSGGDPVTGTYSSISGAATVFADYNNVTSVTSMDVPYEMILTGTNVSYNQTKTGTIAASDLSSPSGNGGSQTVGESFSDVPFGDYELEVRVDLPPLVPLPGNVRESPAGNETVNNQQTHNFTVAQPAPDIRIDASPQFIRRGESSTIEWEVNVAYDIDCSVKGVGIDRNDISYSGGTGTNLNDSEPTPVLDSQADYTITCTAPASGNTFTETTTVKVLPSIEEI